MIPHIVRRARRQLLWMLLLPSLALAVIVTAAQIAEAVRNSQYSSPWLRDNAEAVANLAIRVESGGDTNAYNGSCCHGVLQMNSENIIRYTRLSPEAYRALDLQAQVDVWARLTVDALGASAPRMLAGMSIFDGRPVDGNLVLSCVQLGIGNCQTMLNTGRCSGFADRNGMTICGMADRMAGGAANPGGGTNPGGTLPPSGLTPPPAQSLGTGFQTGAGVSMSNMKLTLHGIAVAVTLLVIGSALLGLLKQYGDGRIAAPDLILAGKKAGLIVIMIFIVLTLA